MGKYGTLLVDQFPANERNNLLSTCESIINSLASAELEGKYPLPKLKHLPAAATVMSAITKVQEKNKGAPILGYFIMVIVGVCLLFFCHYNRLYGFVDRYPFASLRWESWSGIHFTDRVSTSLSYHTSFTTIWGASHVPMFYCIYWSSHVLLTLYASMFDSHYI